jgi:outer membrane receptor protein involved in Fe transport
MTPHTIHRLITIVAGAGALATWGGDAVASEGAAKVFRLPAEPLAQAVLRFAMQGEVSVGWAGAPCEGASRPVQGAMPPAEALAKLLPPGCGFRTVDARTFRIVSTARPPARTLPRSRPPPPATAPPGSTVLADELVVTAEKRAEPLIASPFPVSALSGAELARLGGTTFQAVAAHMGGVASTNLGQGRNKIFVRGLSDGSFTGLTQSTVGLYLDDAPITYNAPDPALRLADVSRIEVLRGPQGSLYGSGSIGGIIRIVTNKPDPSGYSGEVTLDGALTQRGSPSSAAEIMLNAPLTHGAAGRLVAYYERLGGYIDNTRRGLPDVNHTYRKGVRLSFAVPAGEWRFLLSGTHQEIDNGDTQYTLGEDKLTRNNRVREPHDNDISVVTLTAAGPTDLGDLRLTVTGVRHTLHTRYDATGAFDVTGAAAFDEAQRVNMHMAEAELTSAPGGRSHWLVGLFAAEANQPQSAELVAAPLRTAFTRSVYRRDDHLAELAAYGEYAYDLTPKLTLTAGGRLFESWLRSQADEFGLEPGVLPRRQDLKDSGFAPKLRLSYAAAPDAVLYVQAQEGFRTGGFNLPASVVGVEAGETFRRRFRPDRLWSYEAGGEVALFDRSLTLRAAVFRTRWRNVQTDQYLASGLPITVNIGNAANTGVEVEGAWTPDTHWQVRGNLLIDNPEITKSALIFPARPDIRLPGVAKLMGAADVRYRWSPAPGFEAALSGQFVYVGRSYLTFEGGLASRMGNYGVGRVAADLAKGPWRFQLYLDNIADERGDTFAFGNPFMADPQATPLRPRTLGARVQRMF